MERPLTPRGCRLWVIHLPIAQKITGSGESEQPAVPVVHSGMGYAPKPSCERFTVICLRDLNASRSSWKNQPYSLIIPRYQRRTERVDGALLGSYLSGINSRRLRGALSPLLRGAPLSKDAVSRLVGRLRDEFAAWATPDLRALH